MRLARPPPSPTRRRLRERAFFRRRFAGARFRPTPARDARRSRARRPARAARPHPSLCLWHRRLSRLPMRTNRCRNRKPACRFAVRAMRSSRRSHRRQRRPRSREVTLRDVRAPDPGAESPRRPDRLLICSAVRVVLTCMSRRITRPSAPGTAISTACSIGTVVQPMSRAASAGNAACKSS